MPLRGGRERRDREIDHPRSFRSNQSWSSLSGLRLPARPSIVTSLTPPKSPAAPDPPVPDRGLLGDLTPSLGLADELREPVARLLRVLLRELEDLALPSKLRLAPERVLEDADLRALLELPDDPARRARLGAGSPDVLV